MDVLETLFCVQSLNAVVHNYFPANDEVNKVLEKIGDVLIAYENSLEFPDYVYEAEKLPWEDFKDSITCLFRKSGERHLPDYEEQPGIPHKLVNIFKRKSWRNLYKLLGRKIMIFLLRKCFIFIAISPNCYMCLREDEARQHFNKSSLKKGYLKCKNGATLSCIKRQETNIQSLKLINRGYKLNQELSIKSALYSTFHLRNWSRNSSLLVTDGNCLTKLIKKILTQEVGIDLKQIFKNDYDNIMQFMKNVRPLLIKILEITNSKAYPFTKYYHKYINKNVKERLFLNNLTILKINQNSKETDQEESTFFLRPNFNRKIHKKVLKRRRKRISKKLQPIPETQVFKFINKVINVIIPVKLFGSKQNLKRFCKSVIRLLGFGKNVTLRLSELMMGINIKDISWLKKFPGKLVRENVFAKVCVWLWNDLVKVLIYGNFYATEHMNFKNKILYYEHGPWFGIKTMLIENHVNDLIYEKIKEKDLDTKLKINTPATMRLIPKHNGARIILNIKRSPEEKKSMEYLKIFLQQLNATVQKKCCSVGLDLAQVHDDWLKLSQQNSSNETKLYFVKVDIRDAYGSVSHNVLLEYLDNLLQDIMKYHLTLKLVKYSCAILRKDRSLVFTTKTRFAELELALPKRSIIFNNLESTPEIFNTTELMDRLKAFFLYQTVRNGKHLYWIRQGLSQGGSSLSAYLCNLYYAAFEFIHLAPFVEEKSSHLYRRFDDFVYITPNRKLAARFLNIMQHGFPDFNVFINNSKTMTNINEPEQSEGFSVPFCGYLLNSNLQIRNCFSSYNGVEMRYTFNIKENSNIGSQLEKKMSMLSGVRLNKLTLDPTFNNLDTITGNIYEASILMAFRFDAFVRYFMVTYSNPTFMFRCIRKTASRISSTVTRHSKLNGKCVISFQCTLWIVYKAFHIHLREKPTFYEAIIHNLHAHMFRAYKKMEKSEVRRVASKIQDIGVPSVFKLVITA